METIEIKDVIGVVLFSHTAENNTVKLTVEEALASLTESAAEHSEVELFCESIRRSSRGITR